jgi:DNA-binding NarL/FixJ family response regulator
MVRALIADDHPLFREGLRALLAGRPAFEVVAVATTGAEAVAEAERTQPDVAVVDLRMPGGDGLSATTRIRQVSPGTRILVLTSFDGDREVADALAAGAHGYLVKSADPEEIAEGVTAVAAGAAVLSDAVLAALARRSSEPRVRPLPELTDRQRAKPQLRGPNRHGRATLSILDQELDQLLVPRQLSGTFGAHDNH